MRILVTGATGFVGRHLVKRLLRGHGITRIFGASRSATSRVAETTDACVYEEVTCDLQSEGQVKQLLQNTRPEVIFHLAANPLIKDGGPAMTMSNVLPTHYLLEHCLSGTRFVLASSAAVYGNNATVPPASENVRLKPNSIYGATKIASEALVEAMTALGKVRGLRLRLAATVGAGASHGLVPDIVKKLRSNSGFLPLIGKCPGSNKPYTHVSDVVEAFIQFGLRPTLNGRINVANNGGLSVEEVSQLVMDTIRIYKPIRWLGPEANWTGDNSMVRVDSELAQMLGWNPCFNTCKSAVVQSVKDIIKESC